MDATGDGHGWILAAVDAYELPLVRYARRLLGDVDLAADAAAAVAAFGMILRESEHKGTALGGVRTRSPPASAGGFLCESHARPKKSRVATRGHRV